MSDIAENPLTAKRVGQYLIDAGVLTREQLDEALDRQKRMSRAGFHVLLGTILEEMGAIDRQSLEAIILRQRLDEGSVSLGEEADWGPFRSPPEATVAEAERNGHVEEADQQLQGTEAAEAQAPAESPASQPPPEEGALPSRPTISGLVEPDAPHIEEPDSVRADEPAAVQVEKPEPRAESPEQPQLPESAISGDVQDREVSPAEPQQTAAEPTPQVAEPVASDHPAAPQESRPVARDDFGGGRVEIHGFAFSRSQMGLEETEVSAAVSRLRKQVRTLEEQLHEAEEATAHLDSLRRYGEQTIKAADTIADQIHAEAEKQAAAIRERAQQEARRIVGEAKAQHDEILRTAGERAKHVAQEISQNIEDHRQINNRLVEMAERLTAGESE